MNFEELEKEFKTESKAVREDIYKLIASIAVRCQECKELQNKDYHSSEGSIKVKRFAWEIGNSEKVTDMVSKLLSGNIKGKLREAAEEYKDHHVHFKCEEGCKLITKLYESLTEAAIDPSQNYSV